MSSTLHRIFIMMYNSCVLFMRPDVPFLSVFSLECVHNRFKAGDLSFYIAIFIYIISGKRVKDMPKGAELWIEIVDLRRENALRALKLVAPKLVDLSGVVDILHKFRRGRNGVCHRTVHVS